jgi:phage gp45-like
MRRPEGYVVAPHDHNQVSRNIELTQEVLFIKSGKVRLDIYTPGREYLRSCVLAAGDAALLAHGGHGLVILEEAEIIEVKQGPYVGEADKTRFDPVAESLITYSV